MITLFRCTVTLKKLINEGKHTQFSFMPHLQILFPFRDTTETPFGSHLKLVGKMTCKGESVFGAYRQGAILFSALDIVLRQFGLFEEDDGLFTVSHVGDEYFLFWGASLMLWRHGRVGNTRLNTQTPVCKFTQGSQL